MLKAKMKSECMSPLRFRRVIAVSAVLLVMVALIFVNIRNLGSSSMLVTLFNQELLTEERLSKHLTSLEEASRSKFENLLETSKQCASVMAEALSQIKEMKIVRSNLNSIKTSMKITPEVIDNTGAKAYLDDFHKSLAVNDSSQADPNDLSTIKLWWEAAAIIAWYINPPENVTKRHPCQKLIYFGNWPVCQDEQFVVTKPCLVYSFGIANDFSFDDAFGKIGCSVHSFDPSLNIEDHVRNENQNLDVLKIDIEATEWTVLSNLIQTDMLKRIRIFLIEYHLFPKRPLKEDYVYIFKTMTNLREMGFREFFYQPCCIKTSHPNGFNYQAHVGYVNVNF